jgi:asparagine synthase (glutamine-hydrolysing)
VGGILGIWHRDGAPVDAAVLSRMSATIRHRGPDGETSRVVGAAAFVQHRLDTTPDASDELPPDRSTAAVVLAIDGRLHNRDELAAGLSLEPRCSDNACILAAYDKWGDGCAERLNGDFAIAIFDGDHQRLILIRDSIGVRPLYYFCTPRLLIFASEIKAILAHPLVPRAPCDDGLADFLMLGSRPIDRQEVTCFEGIAALVPAHVCVATRTQLVTRRYWDFDPGLRLRLKSFGEYAEAFHERFSRAVERRVRSARPVALSVSGGFDSSSVFCQIEALRRAGRPPIPPALGISYFGAEGTDADERRYLADIERQYQVAIDRFPMEPLQGLIAGTADQVHAIEAPFIDYMWGVTRELHRRAAAFGARTLLTGTWGDQMLFSSAYLADLAGTFRWWTIRRHLKEYRRWFGVHESRSLARRFVVDSGRRYIPRGLLPLAKRVKLAVARRGVDKSWFTDRFLRTALRFAAEPVHLPHAFHSAHARSIYLEARSKYHVHCLEWNDKVAASHGMTVAFPFLDRDLVQFLMAVPGDVQNRGGVPRALAREGLRGVLPDAIRARKWKADFSTIVNDGVTNDLPEIVSTLTSDPLSVARHYVDPTRLDAAIAQVRSDRADCLASWNIADLFGLEVWLRVFFTAP